LTNPAQHRRGTVAPVAIVLGVAALSCAIAACGDDDASSAGKGPAGASLELTIGDVIPLSGRLQDFGPSADKAAEIALDQINDAIAEVDADHEVTLRTEDDQTSTAAGVAVAQKLVNRGATCISGSWSPAVTIAIARAVSIPEGILQISPTSTRDELVSLEDHGLVRGIASDLPEGDDQAVRAFEDLYASSEPTDIGVQTFDAQSFDAVVLCYLAAVAAGSVDGRAMADHVHAVSAPAGRRYTWQQLPEAILALERGKDIDYRGASGENELSLKPGE
jgi:ABC-type branched-subunit amino acid transport system substrate-binding protein